MTELTEIERTTYEAVSEIQGIKRDNSQVPGFAMLFEVYNFLRPEMDIGFESLVLGALRTLYRRGFVEFHQTVNGVPMFGIKRELTDGKHSATSEVVA